MQIELRRIGLLPRIEKRDGKIVLGDSLDSIVLELHEASVLRDTLTAAIGDEPRHIVLANRLDAAADDYKQPREDPNKPPAWDIARLLRVAAKALRGENP